MKAEAGARLPRGYTLRPMNRGEEARLHEIDRGSAALFATLGSPELAAIADRPSMPLREFAPMLARCTVIVAGGPDGGAAGFVAADRLGEDLFIRELSVAPDHARRGIGSALLRAIVKHAGDTAARSCLLSTFRDVPFNAPFYRKHGFVELPLSRAGEPVRRRFASEVPDGVSPQSRLLMVLVLNDDRTTRG